MLAVLNVLLLGLLFAMKVSQRRAYPPDSEVRITIDGDTIRINRERTKTTVIRWKNVRVAYESPTSFALSLARGTIVTIPRREFDDDGVSFWDELRTHLTSTRYLVASRPIASSSITNTRVYARGVPRRRSISNGEGSSFHFNIGACAMRDAMTPLNAS